MSVAELKDALRETLDRRGVLNTLRASIRSEIFNAMEDHDDSRAPLTEQNLLINELIREYLEFNNYKHSLAVFTPETGLPAEPLRRQFVSKQTGLPAHVGASGQELPLLYALLAPPPPTAAAPLAELEDAPTSPAAAPTRAAPQLGGGTPSRRQAQQPVSYTATGRR